MARAFTWHPGAPKMELALALACLRQGGGPQPFSLTVGPLPDQQGQSLAPAPGRKVPSLILGLYRTPSDETPIHPTLAGLARPVAERMFTRGFFLADLVAHVRPLAGHVIYGCLDGPGWRVAVPVRVIPDAQAGVY
jgi:hypothetical protein